MPQIHPSGGEAAAQSRGSARQGISWWIQGVARTGARHSILSKAYRYSDDVSRNPYFEPQLSAKHAGLATARRPRGCFGGNLLWTKPARSPLSSHSCRRRCCHTTSDRRSLLTPPHHDKVPNRRSRGHSGGGDLAHRRAGLWRYFPHRRPVSLSAARQACSRWAASLTTNSPQNYCLRLQRHRDCNQSHAHLPTCDSLFSPLRAKAVRLPPPCRLHTA